jgi:hypothetical protein
VRKFISLGLLSTVASCGDSPAPKPVARRANRHYAVALSVLLGAVACGRSQQPVDAAVPSEDGAPNTLLGRVAAIVVPRCAGVGCHDAISRTHGMDLSTADKIHAGWVNQRGFDHCAGLDTLRVIPGDPAGSLVVKKIEGIGVCSQSQRMPPPPHPPLTAAEIDVVRAWIAAGAPSDRPPPEDGGQEDAGSVDASDDTSPDDAGVSSACTAASPCGPGLTCEGVACGDVWECISHFDDTREHPCAPETMLFCGCDGVTFEASITCPDRPFTHPGACGDGVSCTKEAVRCADPKPVCPEGQEPSVVNDCYSACVPVASCRCFAHWMCPNLAVNTCLADSRCGPHPTIVDAGVAADGP